MWPCHLVQPGEIELVFLHDDFGRVVENVDIILAPPPRLSQVMFFVPWAPRRTWLTAASGLMP